MPSESLFPKEKTAICLNGAQILKKDRVYKSSYKPIDSIYSQLGLRKSNDIIHLQYGLGRFHWSVPPPPGPE